MWQCSLRDLLGRFWCCGTLLLSRSRGIGATTQIRVGGVAGCTYRLDREQGDAAGAVPVARAPRAFAREAVTGVALDLAQLQAGRGDVLPIEIRLARAGDAGCPEVGLTRGARGDLALGDDVGEREPSTGAQDARRLREHTALVGREIDHAVRDHRVERAVIEGQLLDARVVEAHGLVPAGAPCPGKLLGRDVHPGDRAARADLR